MQTFLPYPHFGDSAGALDYRRLGKQRVEAWQILETLRRVGPARGWSRHPAVKMWRGHAFLLAVYGATMCQEWVSRGYKDTMLPRFEACLSGYLLALPRDAPAWLGDEAFHLSHRSNLIRKDPAFYGPRFPGVPTDLPYVWPV